MYSDGQKIMILYILYIRIGRGVEPNFHDINQTIAIILIGLNAFPSACILYIISGK